MAVECFALQITGLKRDGSCRPNGRRRWGIDGRSVSCRTGQRRLLRLVADAAALPSGVKSPVVPASCANVTAGMRALAAGLMACAALSGGPAGSGPVINRPLFCLQAGRGDSSDQAYGKKNLKKTADRRMSNDVCAIFWWFGPPCRLHFEPWQRLRTLAMPACVMAAPSRPTGVHLHLISVKEFYLE